MLRLGLIRPLHHTIVLRRFPAHAPRVIPKSNYASLVKKSFRSRGNLKYFIGGSLLGGTLVFLLDRNTPISTLGIFRFTRAAWAIVRIVFDYKRTLSGLDSNSEEYAVKKSEVHWRSALCLREMCCANGGCFIKVGQHIGALEYLLPREYVETMKVLHSEAPQSPVEELYQVIREDLGKDVEELFDSFALTPQGTASLAQVHKATLKDGSVVAVKVQHPKVKDHAFIDMKTMELLVHLVAWIFPDFQFLWLSEETKKNLPIELDFYNEGQNCEKAAKMCQHLPFLKVPRVYWDLTTERVLVMEFCEGGQVNDKEYIRREGISVNEVSKKLSKLYSEMIFVQGYVHCDPHPGNVLVKKQATGELELVLLDHGLYQTLTDEFRVNYSHLWLSIIRADLAGIKQYAQAMGTGELYPLYACMVTARSWEALTRGIDKEKFTQKEDQTIRTDAVKYLPQISEILNRVPRQMLLIFKTNDLIRGIEATLETRADAQSFITMSKCCIRAVAQDQKAKCKTFTCRIRASFTEIIRLLQITAYEWYLKITVNCQEFLHRKHILALQT